MTAELIQKRRHDAGILLHPSSLPGPHGIGDLGDGARRFVDWLEKAGIATWQVLPLGPTDAHGSPYAGWSAMGGDPHLIALEDLVRAGLLEKAEVLQLENHPMPNEAAGVQRHEVEKHKMPLVRKAARRLLENPAHPWNGAFDAFEAENAQWLAPLCAFAVLHEKNGGAPFWQWPEPEKRAETAFLTRLQTDENAAWRLEAVLQFFFQKQWHELRAYAEARGIGLLGDLPIYVQADSADVWQNGGLFCLDADQSPLWLSGVPPDAFSETGQWWGQPVYDWEKNAATGWQWWKARMKRALALTPRARIDHFRAFAAYWAIPKDAEDARGGHWRPGPGRAFFEAMAEVAPPSRLVAEDLGIIDDAVIALRDGVGLPGMAVLQFAFGSDGENPHLPANQMENQVVYTGTHDNPTTRQWFEGLEDWERERVLAATSELDEPDPVWALVCLALAGPTAEAIFPLQDVLGLGGEARMNTPGTVEGNWRWRLAAAVLDDALAEALRGRLVRHGRLASSTHTKRAHGEAR
jgi:4-alpha-glucanotransferase